jgi:hypothetical protein
MRRTTIFGVMAAVFASTLAVAGSAAAAPAGRVAWLGSPIVGEVTSPAPHTLDYGGQWAVDIATHNAPGPVNVYVAADSARDPQIFTKIIYVDYACQANPGESITSRLHRGGKKVTVGVYYNTTPATLIGTIQYAHVETTRTIGAHNDPVWRWGGSVGTLGSGYDTKTLGPSGYHCWTGVHVHVELTSTPWGRSCYWSGLTTMYRPTGIHSYLGYVNYGRAARVC